MFHLENYKNGKNSKNCRSAKDFEYMCHTTFLFSQNGRFDILIEADCLLTFIRLLSAFYFRGDYLSATGESRTVNLRILCKERFIP